MRRRVGGRALAGWGGGCTGRGHSRPSGEAAEWEQAPLPATIPRPARLLPGRVAVQGARHPSLPAALSCLLALCCPQGKRYSLKEFQEAACAAAAKRFGGLHGSLPARLVEVRAVAAPPGGCAGVGVWACVRRCSLRCLPCCAPRHDMLPCFTALCVAALTLPTRGVRRESTGASGGAPRARRCVSNMATTWKAACLWSRTGWGAQDGT